MPRNDGDEYFEDKNGIIRNRLGHPAKGQSLNPRGRLPRRREEEAREKVEPYEADALEQLGKAVKEGRAWAIQEVLNRRFGKPTDHVELDVDARPVIDLEFPTVIPAQTLPAPDGNELTEDES